MTTHIATSDPTRDSYARIVHASKKVRWDIERDVLRGRTLALDQKYLPDGLSLVHTLPFLEEQQRLFMSQIQGRTYANLFGLVERFINAKVLELSQQYVLGDQVALESLVRFSDEELKHQELFRRIELLAGRGMPEGYTFAHDPDEVARAVLTKCSWAVLALTCHIELFTLAHYKESIEVDPHLSPLWKDVFSFHWKEESQHAVLDELEWRRADRLLSKAERDAAVADLITLVGAIDGILQSQAAADANYFLSLDTSELTAARASAVRATFLAAYRFQYLLSGLEMTRFPAILFGMLDAAQRDQIEVGLASLR